MKIVSVVGARPQFVKAAALSQELRKSHREILVHTGQHYDYRMSGIFFEGLDLPAADVNLEVGSGPHGMQTGAILAGLERLLLAERPDCVLVYGDTNSTLAAALAAAKLSIPVAHVEAGLRSFNRSMPEEINRVLADHVSALLLCPSSTAVDNLAAEGIRANVHLVGDVMLDVLNWARVRASERQGALLAKFGVERGSYLLATLHRAENTDDPGRLDQILAAFDAVGEPVLFPAHPRTRKMMTERRTALRSNVLLIEPLGYVEMVAAVIGARMVLTDSGGLQKEAYWLGVPCVTLRSETEWVETVQVGWNLLVGPETDRIVAATRTFTPPALRPALYGDGHSARRCVAALDALASTRPLTSTAMPATT